MASRSGDRVISKDEFVNYFKTIGASSSMIADALVMFEKAGIYFALNLFVCFSNFEL